MELAKCCTYTPIVTRIFKIHSHEDNFFINDEDRERWQIECGIGCGCELPISPPAADTGELSKKDIELWKDLTINTIYDRH